MSAAVRPLLLDTHALIWWLKGVELSSESRAAIGHPQAVVMVSAASIWEAGIKAAAGRLRIDGDLRSAVDEQGFRPLRIDLGHAALAAALPMYHRDPFDRMLIAQAIEEGLTVVTRDDRFHRYGVPTLDC